MDGELFVRYGTQKIDAPVSLLTVQTTHCLPQCEGFSAYQQLLTLRFV